MRLTALEIQGFKSFPDRTKITIDKGITAVVGPNGSGKSNISDAIRWVLGETSVKQLRGGAKMENVIFGGTQQRGAMGFASVHLYIDNSDRRVEVNADEVIIGRKYYRSGDSEYTINGQNVRLKDIYEMFLDTGLGRDGYSIIGQGRIAEIVGAKSEERREIFEEASGIARYRYHKNEAERRLAATEDNLVRLRDILAELEHQVGPLEKECQKAKKFLELSGRRKELEVTLWVDTLEKARDALREQQRKIEIAGADYERLVEEEQAVDAETEETRALITQYGADASRLSEEIAAIRAQTAEADKQIAVLETNITHNEDTIADLKNQLSLSDVGRESIAAEQQQHTDAVAALREEIRRQEERAGELADTLAQLQAKSAATGERRGAVEAKLASITARLTDLKVQKAAAESAVEASQQRCEAAGAERKSNVEQCRSLEEEQRTVDAFLADAVERVTRLENIKSGLLLKQASRRKTLEAADAAEQALVRDMENTQQRIAVLKDLERSMDGYGGSVKAVMRAAGEHRLRGVIGPVASVLSVKEGYQVAVETALGYALQNVVVENESAAKAAMALLKEQKAGRATFLPLDTVKPSRFDGRLSEGAVCADTLVTCDARYANIVSNLLGRIVVVSDINEASRAARALDYRYRVVTLDGQVVNAGGSFTGGSVSRSAGLFSRRQEIEELKARLEALREKRGEAERATDAAKAEADAVAADLTATESEAITAGNDKVRGEVESNRVHAALSQAQAAGQLLEAECEQLTQSISANTRLAAEAAAEMGQLEADGTALEHELTEIAGSDDSFLTTRTRLSDELSEVRMQLLSNQKDVEKHTADLAALEHRTGAENENTKRLQGGVESLLEQVEAYRARIVQVQQSVEDSTAEVEKRQSAIAELGQKRSALEGSIRTQNERIREIGAQREQATAERARLTEQKSAKSAEYDQTVGKLWEEYELTPVAAQQLCVPFESITELRRQVAELRNRIRGLGNVNVGAIEQYAEVSERYEFTRAQVTDVEEAKKKLLEMIAELSNEMRVMFTQSFAQINRNFTRIFSELFGGGSASLSLEDDADVLESGINIEVSPPGKIIKNLTALSGGEQSLVAICIYFAILAVNPAPFCILDEIEAALDDVNVTRFAQYLRRITDRTQFIVITHRRGTMEEADVLYGVTMQEDGVSKLLRLNVETVDASLVS